jgi:hypothetical protein
MTPPGTMSVPIIRLGDVLLTGPLNELDDKAAVALTEELTQRIIDDHARRETHPRPAATYHPAGVAVGTPAPGRPRLGRRIRGAAAPSSSGPCRGGVSAA